MKIVLCDALSVSMLGDFTISEQYAGRGWGFPMTIQVFPLTEDKAREYLASQTWMSAIWHDAAAQVLSQRLGVLAGVNRVGVSMAFDTSILVAQLRLLRLPEGYVLSADEIRAIPISYLLVRYANSAEIWNGFTGLYGPVNEV